MGDELTLLVQLPEWDVARRFRFEAGVRAEEAAGWVAARCEFVEGGARFVLCSDAKRDRSALFLAPDETLGQAGVPSGSGAVLRIPQGHAMCHASGVRHAGFPITDGQRWVLVVGRNNSCHGGEIYKRTKAAS